MATIAAILLSFLVFFLLILLGIRKKISYILQLSREVELLEGGNLDYPITVLGRDELTALAYGLDCMRQSFQEQIRQETHLMEENQRIITEMSHDLRTPITSMMLYTEILRKGAYKDPHKLMDYIEKIDTKARRMKQLTDHLFEYSLVTGPGQTDLEAPELFEVLFFDLFSETGSYLKQQGFEVEYHLQYRQVCQSKKAGSDQLCM